VQEGEGMVKHSNWIRRMEHTVLRITSFVFSVVSAHAIEWFFSALNHVDRLQPAVTWGIALGFGVLGYFVSRGLAHRLLNKEPVRAYIFICGVFELVEVVCNYAMAAVAVQWITWLGLVPSVQRSILTFLTYVVLSIIPLVTVMLAWVDMDLERAKQGYEVRGFGGRQATPPVYAPPAPSWSGAARPATRTYGAGSQRVAGEPKAAAAPVSSLYSAASAPVPTYQQGYTGAPVTPMSAMPPLPSNRTVMGVPTTALPQGAAAPASAMSLPVMAASASEADAFSDPPAAGWWNRVVGALPFGGRGASQASSRN
jgi:hypothetical protein